MPVSSISRRGTWDVMHQQERFLASGRGSSREVLSRWETCGTVKGGLKQSTSLFRGRPGKRMIIRAKAPLRISFAGGGTDVPPYPELEGGCVLSATIAKYAYGTLRVTGDGQLRIESVDYGLTVDYRLDEPLVYDGKLDLVKAAIRRLNGQESTGFSLFLHSEAPPGSGLGASSTMVVVLVGLLKELKKLVLSEYEIAQLAYVIERHELGIKGGYQDQYAAAFGGFNYMEFYGDRVVVHPLRISADIANELEHNLLLCYTGSTRLSAGIINDQVQRFEAGDQGSVAALRELKKITQQMKEALLTRKFNEFGELLHWEWQAKKRLSPKISTSRIDELYDAARRAGAIGGKLTGAGGGGCLLLYCPFERKHAVASEMKARGCTIMDFTFAWNGLETWRVNGGE